VKAQFQFQVFNVFNHVPLGVPNARCIDCSGGGVITNVDNAILSSGRPVMRQLQFAAKFTFEALCSNSRVVSGRAHDSCRGGDMGLVEGCPNWAKSSNLFARWLVHQLPLC
jgi:hypothetical protein